MRGSRFSRRPCESKCENALILPQTGAETNWKSERVPKVDCDQANFTICITQLYILMVVVVVIAAAMLLLSCYEFRQTIIITSFHSVCQNACCRRFNNDVIAISLCADFCHRLVKMLLPLLFANETTKQEYSNWIWRSKITEREGEKKEIMIVQNEKVKLKLKSKFVFINLQKKKQRNGTLPSYTCRVDF